MGRSLHRNYKLYCGIFSLVLAGSLYAAQSSFEAGRQTLITAADSSKVVLKPAPINPSWIIEGSPKTEYSQIAATYDGTTKVFVWRTTAAKFKWIYDSDEAVTILDGDVFITDKDGQTRHLKAGDVALFPKGAELLWNVPDHVTKSAIVRRPMPKPFEIAMRLMHSVKDAIQPEKAFAGS